jgi:hypothetical protein
MQSASSAEAPRLPRTEHVRVKLEVRKAHDHELQNAVFYTGTFQSERKGILDFYSSTKIKWHSGP